MLNNLSFKEWSDAFAGLLLGTAVGDALGLPVEGLSRRRIHRWHGGEWRHRFALGRGMTSDDTDHAFLVAQALLRHPDDAEQFQRCLAWKLKFWLASLPAGVGLATLKSILKLWLGFPPHKSGVFSAGNGPAMRSAILGAFFAGQPDRLGKYVHVCTRLTHTDPRAEHAALAIAQAAAWIITHQRSIAGLLDCLRQQAVDPEWRVFLDKLAAALQAGRTTPDFAAELGLEKGVTGYCYHTVAVALFACLRHPDDFRRSLEGALDCGGDTDTVGAILGALAGLIHGPQGIPQEWIGGLIEWPRSPVLLERVAGRLAAHKAGGEKSRPVSYFWPGLIPRNLVFLVLVLGHGFRRLAPPY